MVTGDMASETVMGFLLSRNTKPFGLVKNVLHIGAISIFFKRMIIPDTMMFLIISLYKNLTPCHNLRE